MTSVKIHVTCSPIGFDHSITVGRFNGGQANYDHAASEMAALMKEALAELERSTRGAVDPWQHSTAWTWLLRTDLSVADRDRREPWVFGDWSVRVSRPDFGDEPDDQF